MATTAEVEEYSAATRVVVAAAAAQLTTAVLSSPAPDELTRFFTNLMQTAGRGVASIAADFYDDMRAKAPVRRGFRATVSDPIPDEQASRIVAWALQPKPKLWTPSGHDSDLWTPDDASHDDIEFTEFVESEHESSTTNSQVSPDIPEDVPESVDADDEDLDTPELEEPTPEEVNALLGRKIQRLIMQPARDTIADSVERDPSDARWARVPKGEVTCAFCMVMASRGAVYLTRAAAVSVVGRRGRTRGKRALGEDYHDFCDCEAVPMWDDSDYPEHYDPDAFYEMYEDGRDAAHSPDLKKILAKMRELHGLH